VNLITPARRLHNGTSGKKEANEEIERGAKIAKINNPVMGKGGNQIDEWKPGSKPRSKIIGALNPRVFEVKIITTPGRGVD